MTLHRSNLRLLAVLTVLFALVASWAMASRAEAAKVANPGSFVAKVSSGTIRIKSQVFNFDDTDPNSTITFSGTVAANGNVTIPVAGHNFPPFTLDGGYTVRIIPTNDTTGNLNPLTGVTSLRLRVYIKIDGVPFGGGCAIGTTGSPIDVNALITGTTSPPGPNTPISGTPYTTSGGTVKIVNNSFSVPASNSCGIGGGTVDDTLGIPSAAGNNEAQFTLATTPVLQKAVLASFTATPNSGPAGTTVNFNASGSTLSAGVRTCTPALPTSPNCGYRWDFDGNGTVDQVTNTPTTSFTYATAGAFNPRLTIYDVDQDTDNTTRTVTIANRPDLSIDKSHTGNFRTGQQGSYNLSVSNGSGAVGPTTGTTTVSDVLPAGLTYVSATGSGWSCSNLAQVVTCTRAATIAAGATAPAITVNVNVADSARPSVTNTATVSTPDETAVGNNSDTDPTDIDAVDVAITKSHTGSFRVGRNEPYTLNVRNDGTLATTGTTTISDTLPTGMNYFSSSAPAGWSCNGSGSSFSCTNPDPLPVGYDEDITLTVSVDGTAVPMRVNTATISTPGDTDPTDDSSADPTVVVAAPDLAIDKSHDQDFRVGGTGTYELEISNDGALPTAGTTTVTDSVPAGLPVQSVTGSGWTCDAQGQDITCTSTAILQPDESAPIITITTGVTEAALPSVTNTATVATSGVGPSADPNPLNDTDSDPTTVTAVDLAIDKSHTGTFPVGGNGTFTLSVRNVGTAATVGTTTVTDSLPADLTFVSASGSGWNCGATDQDVTCTRAGVIDAGNTAPNITLNVTVANTTAIDLTNTASVATTDDINTANDSDSDTVTLTAADLQIVKSHTGDFRVGTTRTYELRVRNVGPLPSFGTTTVTDVLPAGLTYNSASGPGFSCGASGQTVTCTRTNSFAGGGPAATIQLQVDVGAAALPSVTNTATVANSGDRNPANDSSADPTTVTSADLAIAKAHQGQLRAGGQSTYEIDVDNVGTAPTNSVATVTDVLPTGLTYAGSTGDDWNCSASGQTVTCEHPAGIAAGGSASLLNIRVDVAGSASGQITNTATVATANDSSNANDSDDDTSGVGRIDVAIDKSHTEDLSRGGTSSYTLAVENVGDLATDGSTTVTDTLPAGLSYSSATGSGWNCAFASGTVTCTRSAPIGGNSSAPDITLEVNVSGTAPSSISNTADVATRDDGNNANDSDTDVAAVTAGGPDAALSMRTSGDFRAGGSGTFEVSIRNRGPVATTGATTVTFAQTASTFVSGSGAGWSCAASSGGSTCTHAGALAPGERSDFNLDVMPDKTGFLMITDATVSTPGDTDSANNSASDLRVLTKIDVSTAIGHTGGFSVGNEGTFSVTAANNGSAATVGTTVVKVPLPDSLDYVSAAGSGWNCAQSGNGAVCEHPGSIGPATGANFELKVKPSKGGAASVTATATTAEDADASNDSSTDTVDVSGGTSALQLKKAKIKVPKSGVVPVPVTCPAGGNCTGTLDLSVKGKSVGSAKYSVTGGSSTTVGVKLKGKAKRALAKKGKLKVVATAGSATAKLKLSQPKKKG